MTPLVEMIGITKRFGPATALENVSWDIMPGQIQALVGENGAGKTTLMRILYGAIPPTDGKYQVDGAPTQYRTSAEAIAAGIGMVSQHYSIIPELTCLQNLMLGAEPGWVMNKAAAAERAQTLAEQMGFSFDWRVEAGGLGPAGAQKLEILKLLWRESRILILDEPTAMLSPSDGDALYESLRLLVDQGATVVVVTHRLSEVTAHCERVCVLRGGKKVAERDVKDTNLAELTQLIVGHEMPETSSRPLNDNESLLEVQGLTIRGARGDEAVKEATFAVRRGEVVGLAGVDGNGQRELIQALIGMKNPESGWMLLGGEIVNGTGPRSRLEMGFRIIPEDRHDEGVIDDWSLEENAALGGQWMIPFARGAMVDREGRLATAGRIAERFSTRFADIGQPIADLSGGNQQRFVNGRALETTPRFVLAFQPARGLDVDATRRLYEGLYEECGKGAGALVVSYDLDELLEYCDRIIVIHRGHVVEPAPGKEKDRIEIGRLMVVE